MSLIVERVSIGYVKKAMPAVREVSFVLEKGQIGCLLGASGSGKSSLLRAIAGFEPLIAGMIKLNGEVLSTPTFMQAPESRQVGLMFQDYALFPHMSVWDNIIYGLNDWPKSAQKARGEELLALIGLPTRAQAQPHELSGGEQQRVALARALAPRPRLLLLDEPFSNLDNSLRESLSHEVLALLHHEGITTLLVTHHHLEAFVMANVVGVLMDGQLRQWTSPYELYHSPLEREVATFIGQSEFIRADIIDNHHVKTALGVFGMNFCPMDPTNNRTRFEVLIRPDDVIHDDDSPLTALVLAKTFRGADFLYTLQLDNGERVFSLVPSHHNHPIGEKIGIRAIIDHVNVYPQTRD